MKKLSTKSKIGLFALVLSMLVIDMQTEFSGDIVTAGTFLGTGVEVTEGTCVMGAQTTYK
jgi:hypothetical protein